MMATSFAFFVSPGEGETPWAEKLGGGGGGTIRENCLNLSGAEFRLKVCVHSPGERLRRVYAQWHTLSGTLSLVGVNAASSYVYDARALKTRNIRYLSVFIYELERIAPAQT